MKEFTVENVNRKLLVQLEDCEDAAAVKAYINGLDFKISDENAEKLYQYVNTVHGLDEGESAGLAGGGCSDCSSYEAIGCH